MKRTAPLAMDSSAFRSAGHRLIDHLADLLASIPNRKVTPGESPSTVRAALKLDGRLPEEGAEPAALLEETAKLLFDHSLFNAHPRFFGYITSSPAPIGMLGDLLAAAVNANAGAWILSPAATEIEVQTVQWIAELIGYPRGSGGLLVSGGNMANLAAFFAARTAKGSRSAGAEPAMRPGPQLRVYCSSETHTWIEKAADLSGLGAHAIRWIPVDRDLAMDVGALRRQVLSDRNDGDLPFLVVGTAGSVSTGVVDPLGEMAALCRELDLWFHVDGAYGGFAAAVPEAPDDLRALSEADSVAVDPHKWLYAPLEAGCVLLRRPEHLRAAFAHHPPYYRFDEEMTNFVEYGPQNSRGFRALKVWLGLRHAGASGYRRMISDDIRLAGVLGDALRRHPALELLTQALSIVTFRYLPPELARRAHEPTVERYLNALNEALVDRIQWGGDLFLSNAVVRGRYALRACIVNFRTERDDVEAVPEIVARVGETLHETMREAGVG